MIIFKAFQHLENFYILGLSILFQDLYEPWICQVSAVPVGWTPELLAGVARYWLSRLFISPSSATDVDAATAADVLATSFFTAADLPCPDSLCLLMKKQQTTSIVVEFYITIDTTGCWSWVEQGLMSHQTHYRSYRGHVFMGRKTQPTVSKYLRLKEDRSYRLGFNPIRSTHCAQQIFRMKKEHKIHGDKQNWIYAQWNGPTVTTPNPENCKNCSTKCAYDCAQLRHTIQHRTDLIISPLTSRQPS